MKERHVSKFKIQGELLYNNNRNFMRINKYNKGAILKSIINVSNEVKNKHNQIHPTEKPVKLLQILIELIDNQQENFTILDPFAGSCSQAIACYNLNKNFIGCEIYKEYYNAAVNSIYK